MAKCPVCKTHELQELFTSRACDWCDYGPSFYDLCMGYVVTRVDSKMMSGSGLLAIYYAEVDIANVARHLGAKDVYARLVYFEAEDEWLTDVIADDVRWRHHRCAAYVVEDQRADMSRHNPKGHAIVVAMFSIHRKGKEPRGFCEFKVDV